MSTNLQFVPATDLPITHRLHPGYGHQLLRDWHTADTHWDQTHLCYPIFVVDTPGKKNVINSMPGQFQWSVDRLDELVAPLMVKGLKSVILFGVITEPGRKDPMATWADHDQSPVILALRHLRQTYPQLYLITDVCLCQYTSHGHCGVLTSGAGREADIDNDASLERLATVALRYAMAGAHMIAPSDMMDGRILAIKKKLLQHGLGREIPVMAYSAKFASCMYGPFRDAAHSTPGFGDRRAYQLPPGASGLATRALLRDAEEGADFIMVKPAGMYLDIIREAKEKTDVPIACYQVSGEFAMLYHAAAAGAFDLKRAVSESFQSLRRAGATIIITYFTPQALDWLAEGK